MRVSPVWVSVSVFRPGVFKWGLVALAAVYLFTPAAIVQYLCAFFAFVLLGSRFYSEYLARHLRVLRCDSELRVFRGEWVEAALALENTGCLPAFMVILSDGSGSLSVLKYRKMMRTLPPRSRFVMRWQGLCAERGVFTLGPAVLRCADPLCIFPFEAKARETAALYVYPVLRNASRLARPSGVPLGSLIIPNPLYEDTTRCKTLRPYAPGDEPRRINWKMTARMGYAIAGGGGAGASGSGGYNTPIMVNEYEATASYPLMIFLNADPAEYPAKKRALFIERAIEAAAALCLHAASGRQELGIVFYTAAAAACESGVSVIAPRAFTLVPILERLASLNWAVKSAEGAKGGGSALAMLEQGKNLPYGTRFLYTGPDLGDDAYARLNSLKRCHLTLEYLIIDDRALSSLVPGNSRRYKMKESGREIV